ncbi:hypothetical protein [Pedobacter sp. SYP-B3415]|uniref:hypothetical protein n=1 Tax=Pedobacter sp. SYP-B3415 TaxID=2496641 RepID=UPI00101CEF90|nr:hypothetical protein [Pedobacter sp. SYP-B3415]
MLRYIFITFGCIVLLSGCSKDEPAVTPEILVDTAALQPCMRGMICYGYQGVVQRLDTNGNVLNLWSFSKEIWTDTSRTVFQIFAPIHVSRFQYGQEDFLFNRVVNASFVNFRTGKIEVPEVIDGHIAGVYMSSGPRTGQWLIEMDIQVQFNENSSSRRRFKSKEFL